MGDADSVLQCLRDAADPAKARVLSRFFKTGPGEYGEGDRFLGLTVPVQRRIARGFKATPLPELARLLASPFHESRFTALVILTGQYTRGDESARREAYAFYCQQMARVNSWDLVDTSAPQIAGAYLWEHPSERPILLAWAASPHLWTRRVAVVSLLTFIRHGNFEWLFRVSERLLSDPHDLIHKAVGWMLREAGKRSVPELRAFLDRHAARMPRTMLRYSLERLPREIRFLYLKRPPV